MNPPEILAPLPQPVRDQLGRDIQHFGQISLAAGFALGALLASTFWLWLTWGR